jgi:hypothetical protein
VDEFVDERRANDGEWDAWVSVGPGNIVVVVVLWVDSGESFVHVREVSLVE